MKFKPLLLSIVVAGAALALAVPASASSSGSRAAHPAAAPCGRTATAPTYQHVIWIFMENQSYGSVIGSARLYQSCQCQL